MSDWHGDHIRAQIAKDLQARICREGGVSFAFHSRSSRLQNCQSDSPPALPLSKLKTDEAANTMKFGQAFHHTHLVLAWTAYAYRDQLGRIGELDELRSWVKQGADYTFNAHSRADRLVGMFNIADRVDFDYEGPPEEWASLMKFSRANGSFAAYVDRVHRGSEIVGDAAAAMAASYLVFRDSEPAYAGKCLNASKSLYALASDYQGSFIYGGWAAKNPSMASHLVSYRSSGVYQDEIAVAASFLYLATNETKYLNAAKGMFGWALNKMSYKLPVYFSWDDKLPGVAFLLSMVDGKPGNTYDKLLRQGFAFWLKDCQGKKCGPGEAPRTKACKCVYYTPKGLAVGDAWGSLASVTNIGFVMLQHAHWLRSFNATDSYAAKLIDWVISQVNYILGDNNGFSFMAGFGTKFPRFSYHISSYNSLIDFPMRGKPMNLVAYDFEMQGTSRVFKTQNRFIPYGAIQGGPCYNNDTIVDNHRDYVFTESAQDYAAAFLGAAAGLIDVYKLNEKGTDCGLDLGWSHRNANRAKRYPKYKANDAYHTCFGKSKDEIARLMAE